MDFKCGGSSGGSGRDDLGQGSQGGDGLKRKWNDLEASMKAVKENAEKSAKIRQLMQDNVRLEKTALGDLETSMKAMKDAFVQENAEKSAKIRRLMEDIVRLEETVVRSENLPLHGPIRRIERQNPFTLFPPEVWGAIIEQMNRSSDLEMLSLAFPQLEPLMMERKKTTFLLKNVLPLVCKHLDLKDINQCRLVCEKWNRDVCALLANWNAPNLLAGTSKTPVPEGEPPYSFREAYEFTDDWKIQKFLEKTADCSGNPLFGRFLRLDVDSDSEWKEFWNPVLELVKKFGEHVWNLKVDFSSYDRTKPIALYEALQRTLIHLPNLKYFSVIAEHEFSSPAELSSTHMPVQIRTSPLPPMPYLQSLTLDFGGETGMMSAFSSLFSPQIHRLEFLRESFGSVNLKDEWLRGLISLEFLKINLTSGEDILRLLKFPSSNLKQLCLYVEDESEPPVSFTSEEVCNLLENFSRLERLKFGPYCEVERWSSSLDSRIYFSRLKTLEIGIDDDEDDLQHNLDFLLWFPSLKHLVFKKNYITNTTPTAEKLDKHSTLKIRNHMYNGNMLDSNVWTLIPSLELLEVSGIEKLTREMFENRVG